MAATIRVAGVQMDIALADRPGNLQAMLKHLAATSEHGAALTVFPECALSGYCFDDLAEAREQAETIPGPATEEFQAACRRHGGFVVFGLLERHEDRLFNACALVGPQGLIGSYRKIHLPYLGVDRFATPGDRPFQVHDAGDLRVGMNICYDGTFPESARVMTLLGADLIVLPTNWPPGAECTAQCIVNARALENQVYYLAVNRIGTERGFRFIGNSRLSNPSGENIAHAGGEEASVLYGDIDPAWARNKHIVRIPNKHEIDRIADRRPEMYLPITAAKRQ